MALLRLPVAGTSVHRTDLTVPINAIFDMYCHLDRMHDTSVTNAYGSGKLYTSDLLSTLVSHDFYARSVALPGRRTEGFSG